MEDDKAEDESPSSSKKIIPPTYRVLDPEAAALERRTREAHHEYGRGRKIAVKSVRDKKLRTKLKSLEDKYKDATLKAKDAEILLEHEGGYLEPEGELERTYKIRQDELLQNVDIETAKKGFELKLEGLGPYVAEYTRNGRQLLLTGRKGHVSTMDWRAGKLGCELQLQETVRDAKWLHNDQFFALAQKKYVYVYDHAGVELHCLKNHVAPLYLEFLPFHFLLASAVCIIVFRSAFLLTEQGRCRLLEVHRYINRPEYYRDAHAAGHADFLITESTQCYFASRSSERNSHTMVSEFYYTISQGTRSQRSREGICNRSKGVLYDNCRSGYEISGLGYSKFQGPRDLLSSSARNLTRCK